MPSATLPTELWIVIIDHIIEALVNPAEICDYRNFPEVNYYIRAPLPCSAIVPSYRELRLVCRAFNELLKTPPRLFMKRPKTEIPQGTRALFFTTRANSFGCLHRLLEDPSRSRRIVTLYIPRDAPQDSNGLSLVEVLVKNADLLSSVRSLAFNVVQMSEATLNGAFWDTLNEAFPALVSLALRPKFRYGTVMPSLKDGQKENPMVTLERLEILEVDHVLLYDGLNLPLLRHVALGCCNQQVVDTLARSPRLESVLLRTIQTDRTIDLSSLPDLKLLGLPVNSKNTPVPLPRDYAGYICAHVPGRCTGPALVQWVIRVASYFKNVPQIALDLTLVDWARRAHQESAVRRSLPELRSSGLTIEHLPLDTSYIVIKRIAVEQKDTPAGKISSPIRSKTLWDKWNRFRHAAYYRLHL